MNHQNKNEHTELEKAIRNNKITWTTFRPVLKYCFAILLAFVILSILARESTADYVLNGYNQSSNNKAQYEALVQQYQECADHESKKVGLYSDYIEQLKSGADISKDEVKEAINSIGIIADVEGKAFVESGSRTEFLRNNASPELQDRGQTFVDVGFDYGIDPDLLVCIAFADSGLGTDLATAYNYGNVGNNDSGDRVHLDNVTDGITAIARTLNNQYLGDYTMIGELSGGGRVSLGLPDCSVSGEYCYATSIENWNRNVLNCMRDIKQDESVDETYQYKLP